MSNFSLQNLSLTFPSRPIFEKANLTVLIGERIGVLGLNGEGKSSLFRLLIGEIKADQSTPSFLFDRPKNLKFFYIPQELPQECLTLETLEEIFFYFYPDLSLEEETGVLIWSRFKSYAKFFSLQGNPVHFSGGQWRKVALCLGLASDADVLLWDEPTNHLDLETIEIFEEKCLELSKTQLIISHDRSLLQTICNRIIHIHQRKISKFEGSYEEYLNFLKTQQENQQKFLEKLNNKQRREKAWIERGVSARRTKSKKRIEEFQNLKQEITSLKSKFSKPLSLSLMGSNRKTKQLLEFTDVEFAYPNHEFLFKNMSFILAQGNKIGILGPNGAGKSTFLKLILGEVLPTKGTIKRAQDCKIAFFSQQREELPLEQSPWEWFGEGTDHIFVENRSISLVAYLEGFLFGAEQLRRPIKTFSGGEKNRLRLAKFLQKAADIYIFDEPTNDLDLETIGILEEELGRFQGAIILVSHDRTFLENTTQICWAIEDQGLLFFQGGLGQAREFLEQKALLLSQQGKKSYTEHEKGLKQKQQKQEKQGKTKISFKEQKRLELIPREIEEKEKLLEEVIALLSSPPIQSDRDWFKQMATKEGDLRQSLEKLYEEWAELEKKSIS